MYITEIKRVNELAKLPARGSESSAGYDLCSTEDYTLKPLERKLFKTGLIMAIAPQWYGRIAPRSGLAFKDGIDTMAGVIDSDYRGEVGVILINLGQVEKVIKTGDKIAQIIFENFNVTEFKEVKDISETQRGQGGFGSTDAPRVSVGPPTHKNEEVPHLVSGITHGKSLSELYEKAGGIPVKKRYSEEVKERQQQ